MRKSVVFALALATMFFLGTSNAGAGIAGIFADLDIKPQSCPNPVNVKSHGVLSVAILGADDFDPTTIDPESVALGRADGSGGSVSPLLGPPGPQPYIEDVGTPFNGAFSVDCYDCSDWGGDGILDLTLKFDAQDLIEAIDGDLQDGQCLSLQLTGTTYDGTLITGADNVVIIVK